MDTDELTEHEIKQLTPPQLAQFAEAENCYECAAYPCDPETRRLCNWGDVGELEQDYRDEQRQAWRPL